MGRRFEVDRIFDPPPPRGCQGSVLKGYLSGGVGEGRVGNRWSYTGGRKHKGEWDLLVSRM